MTTGTFSLTESWAADSAFHTTRGFVSVFSYQAVFLDAPRAVRPVSRTESAPWISLMLPLRKEEGTCQITPVLSPAEGGAFTPRTSLGRRLLSLRNRAIASGMKLLSEDEVLKEVKRRRGELGDSEAHVY